MSRHASKGPMPSKQAGKQHPIRRSLPFLYEQSASRHEERLHLLEIGNPAMKKARAAIMIARKLPRYFTDFSQAFSASSRSSARLRVASFFPSFSMSTFALRAFLNISFCSSSTWWSTYSPSTVTLAS